MTNLSIHTPRLALLVALALGLWLFAGSAALAATTEPTPTVTPPPPTVTATPTATLIPSPTYQTPTRRPTQTPTLTPIATEYFWGAAEATALVATPDPAIAARAIATRSAVPTASSAPPRQTPVAGAPAWISPAQQDAELAEIRRLTAVEARLQAASWTQTPQIQAASVNIVQATPTTDKASASSAIPSRMKLVGPIDPNSPEATTGATDQAQNARAGLPLPPPIRYAGVPSQSTEAGWMNGTTLWLAVPHRTQFDGTLYAQTNCGPASLGMILEAYGLKGYPTDAVRGEVNRLQGDSNPDNGTSLYAIASVAQRTGLHPVGLSKRWTLDEVRQSLAQGRPVITLTRYADLPGNGRADPGTNHYIVLSGLAGDQFIYNDPAYSQGSGRGLLIPADTLARAWANSDVPGQAVAFALNDNGAGLMSPLAIRQLALSREADLGEGEEELSEEEMAELDERALLWAAAIRTLTNGPALHASFTDITMDSLSEALAAGTIGPVVHEPPPTEFPWPLLAIAGFAVLMAAATITFAAVRVLPAAGD